MLWVTLFLILFWSGCAAPPPAELALPEVLGDSWRLAETSPVAEEDVQGEPARLGVQEALEAHYDGPSPLLVTCYRMRTGSSAFELMQKWRPIEGSMAIYGGPWFVTLKGRSLSHEQLTALAEDLEKSLPAN